MSARSAQVASQHMHFWLGLAVRLKDTLCTTSDISTVRTPPMGPCSVWPTLQQSASTPWSGVRSPVLESQCRDVADTVVLGSGSRVCFLGLAWSSLQTVPCT